MSSPFKLKGNERILVVRTDRIGDLVLATPVFECLKRNFSNLIIDALVSQYARPILDNNPFINEVFIYGESDRRSLLNTLRQNRYGLCLLIYPRFRLVWLLYRAGISIRVGTAFRWYSFLFTHKVYQHRKEVKKHELEYNLEMLGALGIQPERILPKIYLSKSEQENVDSLFRDYDLKSEDLKVVIHPGGGRSSLPWSEQKFGQLALELQTKLGVKIIITGEKSERPLTHKVFQMLKSEAIDFTGKLNLRQLCGVLSKVNLLVTNSTGPLHIAAALGTRVAGFFCPIKTASPVRWGPYGEGHQVLMPPVEPCNCSVTNCRKSNCMDLISVEDVFEKVKLALSNIKSGVAKN